ncbi:glycerol-3-phosphate dehydrogenase [Aurantimonas sp. C2-6-R+9]|uniref:glycerol-3-phosphate dehydrogenase n=1 Tax=unclassified Aurantimonas TaxID=2638230 RepID=UPI002E170DEB|nr:MULTISPECIES: glycerol-3-phosphate dehydrogenase [unclassified Aurantimonas]MEC5291318.1 glycerol-3-phosphate dehydrogenase [Aurantimonas sp. C2-3-R2]MEC5381524.1 glycerol-3-phosphate dehydrogenase [Aurantimonas sp. C2-6-R+9]MEC5412405.1 glycerol-3-phosphate dehydrogenase [Aurantimonas sp. C2-4-R8]
MDYDVFIIGGGINGCGIARDAAGRGYRVGLAEMNDLASGTSSWSTKLVHGGLRYLEHYEFSLVRHALMEREVLWGIAPHIIRPLRFILPHHSGLRPAWLLRLGLFLYDHLGGRKKLRATTTVDLDGPMGAPLKDEFHKGFEYSDARVDDARLVVLNARDAAARGADIMVRTKVLEARREAGLWQITLADQDDDRTYTVSARFLVNVGGPWVDAIIQTAMGQNEAHNIRLVQGSHIVTRKLYDHDRAYIFQNADGRIIFTIPYEEDFTLVGTTDQDFDGDPADAAITETETQYLLSAASEYFKRPLAADDIVWSYSGVRPLFDDGASKAQEATRDYVLKVEGDKDEPAVLNGFGGKITTYRVLSEEVLEKIERRLGARGSRWTGDKPLPGGDFPVDGLAALEEELQRSVPELDARTVRRLARGYGTDIRKFIRFGELGQDFGHGLYEAEVDWLVLNEWARTAEDILWRRTKLGLRFDRDQQSRLAEHMKNRKADWRKAAE